MTLVRFNDAAEFIADLARNPGAVASGLVRTTTIRYPVMNGAITRLAVVASAKVQNTPAGLTNVIPDYDVVELRELIGDLWGNGDDDGKTAKATERLETIEQAIRDAGLRVGHGRYIAAETETS